MRKKEKSTFRKIEHHRTETFFLIVRGLEVGVVAGLVSALYRFLLSKAESANHAVLTAIAGKPLYIALFLAALAGIGYLVSQLVRWQPLSSSSGIPQITGEIRGHLDAPWWQVLLAKIAGGTLSILSGLSLGREGPSIQLGGMAAKGVAKVTKADKTTQLRMISCGGGAGLAAAFNAPLAGMMFTLEEIRQYQAQVDANPVIPLYDLNGKVIGSFVRGTTQDLAAPDPVIAQKLEEMTGGKSANFLPSAQPIPVKHDYPTTANGESYGSYGDRDKYGYPPQLIAVIGDNDQRGYVRLSDFRAANRPAAAVWDV